MGVICTPESGSPGAMWAEEKHLQGRSAWRRVGRASPTGGLCNRPLLCGGRGSLTGKAVSPATGGEGAVSRGKERLIV